MCLDLSIACGISLAGFTTGVMLLPTRILYNTLYSNLLIKKVLYFYTHARSVIVGGNSGLCSCLCDDFRALIRLTPLCVDSLYSVVDSVVVWAVTMNRDYGRPGLNRSP